MYAVGGCVRDRLLGKTSRDRDWVVVGSTVTEMLKRGFQQVGRDFPVFLHPETKEEYALARTERKTTPGHHGFQVYADETITLEEDLARRDLTINSMAVTPDGQLIDPFSGARDLEQGLLRHTSPAFSEDPLRVLRLARFAAQYEFHIVPDTLALARRIVASGELTTLAPERIWQELDKALQLRGTATFIRVLRTTGALRVLFPEIDRLFGIPQPENFHPEIDTGKHTLLALDVAARLSSDPRVRFAVLVHDLGKGTTPTSILPRHIGHEAAGVPLVRNLCERYRIPGKYQRLAENVTRHHLQVHRILESKPATVIRLLEHIDAFRRTDDLDDFLLACQADVQGRKGFEHNPYPQADFLRKAFRRASEISTAGIISRGYTGAAVREQLYRLRVQAVKQIMEQAE